MGSAAVRWFKRLLALARKRRESEARLADQRDAAQLAADEKRKAGLP